MTGRLERVMEENQRLRSVITDMRREVESLRFVGHEPAHNSASVLSDAHHDSLSGGKGRREAVSSPGEVKPQESPGPGNDAFTILVKENKELRGENEKLLVNCVSTPLLMMVVTWTEHISSDLIYTGKANGD